MKFLKAVFCLLTSFTIALPLIAQRTDTGNVRQLGEAVIYAERIDKQLIPVQTLSGAALKQLNVYSVADAIRYFSGVQVKDYGGIGGLKTVNIRSLGTQHTGVFYDGIELGNAQNGTVDLGRFSLDNMEAISLHNGQKSNIFQPAKDYASAGAVYMVSHVPVFNDNKRDHFRVTFKTGSFSLINPSLLWERQLSKKVNASFNAEYLYTDGRYKFSYSKKDGYDTTEYRKNGDVTTLRLEAGLFGKVKDGEWKAKAYFYTSERGYPGAAVREDPGKFTHQDRQWDQNLFAQGSYRKSFSKLYSLQLSGKYAYDYLHYLSDPRQDVTTMYVDNHYYQQEAYFSSANLFSILPSWTINISTDILYNTLRADLVDFVYPSRYTGLTAIATSLQPGRLKIQASLLGTFVHERTRTASNAASDKNEYTPSLIIGFQPFRNPDLNLRTFYKRVFRMPTLNDLYYTFIGNKLLDPEYTTQYNAGATYIHQWENVTLQKIEVQTDAYFNQVKNKIVAMPTSNQFRWTMVNLGYTEIRGLDMAVQTDFKLNKSLLLASRLSYTYQRAQDFTDHTSPYFGDQIPYIPWHSGSVVLSPAYAGWGIHYSFIYTGERYESEANIPENYSRPWYTHDISLSKSIQLKQGELRLAAEVNNLLNQQYEVVQWYPMPGTNFKLTAVVSL